MWFKKASPRRQAIREDVAEVESQKQTQRFSGYAFLIALVFFVVAGAIQFWPNEPLPYREGEHAPLDIRAQVSFSMPDPAETKRQQDWARSSSPPVLVLDQATRDHIQGQLSALKQDVQGLAGAAQLPPETLAQFPGFTDQAIKALQSTDAQSYESEVRTFLNRGLGSIALISDADQALLEESRARQVLLTMNNSEGSASATVPIQQVFSVNGLATNVDVRALLRKASVFPQTLTDPILNYILALQEPTFRYDAKMTKQNADRVAMQIMPDTPLIQKDKILVARGDLIDAQKYNTLLEAHAAFLQSVEKANPWAAWLSRLGRLMVVLSVTVAGVMYVVRMSKTNLSQQQAWAVCGLLLVTLAIAKTVAGIIPWTLYGVGLAPTLLVAIILVIAYNQRFALGVSALHALLVTITLGQSVDFFLPILAGVAAFSFGLGEIRTRGKLIEVGVMASAAMFAAVWAVGLARMVGGGFSPWLSEMDLNWVARNSMWAAGSGLFVAMFALAVLPTIERLFNITTAMTLLELCDANKPLLRRLSQEAGGTFNHSLMVGIMAEAAGNAIGANGLLCRVGAYYHDVGKLSKPQYFIENQKAGGPNRHDKLSPAMSLLIIVGHVKDGIELAREYGLPRVVHQFIAQHHGTTLVEYFFHAARKRAERDEEGPSVSDTEFRYPGPKPQTPEAAIVMICDGCESVVRAIDEPTPGRIESAVHTMIMKRLMDGQFGECDLTLRDLSVIEETLVRTLGAIHHGRVGYPSDRGEDSGGMAEVSISQPA